MARGNYERVPIEKFGAHLLDTGDLDPVYIALHKMELDYGQLSKWLIAYWCFYHCGVASYMSDIDDKDIFWQEMMTAAVNDRPTPVGGRWPRGHERRHFRGQQGIDAIESLSERYDAADMWITELSGGKHHFSYFASKVQRERGFGPWISFKVADMFERLELAEIDFSESEIFMFKDPREAALRLWRQKMGMSEHAMPKDEPEVLRQIVGYLKHFFKDYTAPPRHERGIGLQEVETILCKWKSSMNGHYPPQNDTIEIRAGLTEWADASKTAALMLNAMPEILPTSLEGKW